MAFEIPLVARIGFMAALREAMVFRSKSEDRKRIFAWALHRAKELGRPLMVVGDPACVSAPPVPVENVQVHCLQAKTDISTPRSIPVADDSVVVFVMWALESVQSMEGAWAELLRASGSPSNIFIVHAPKQSVLAWILPGKRWVIETAPPTTPELRYLPTQSDYPMLQPGVAGPPGFHAAGMRPYGGRNEQRQWWRRWLVWQ